MIRLKCFDDLQAFVRQVLCDRADLDPQTPMHWSVLRRQAKPCGLEFTVIAPRSVRLSAIWESEACRILFYDQNLERFQVSRVGALSFDHIPATDTRLAMRSMFSGK